MKSWLLLAFVGAADSALVVIVDGIPADQLTKRVVQHAVDDVIPIVEAPEQVIDVKFFPVPGYPTSVRIESTVRMGDPWRTCGDVYCRILLPRRVVLVVRAPKPRGQARQAGQTVGAVHTRAALARPRVDEGARRRRARGDTEARGQRQRRVIPCSRGRRFLTHSAPSIRVTTPDLINANRRN